MRTRVGKLKATTSFAVLVFIIGFAIIGISLDSIAEPQFLEEMVPMRDGDRLHTFVYLPDCKVWSPALISIRRITR